MLSIIIPIYNVEEYIGKCLCSIAEQTYTDYEVLMIDDGSTDGSAAICKQFTGDKRFVYFYKENGGVSSARNLGLDLSKGKYIGFIDPDDYISADFYSSMIEKLEREEADMCQCQWLTRIDESGNILLQEESIRERDDYMIALKYAGAVWDKVYRRSLFKMARFDASMSLYEDLEVFSKILRPDIKLVFSDSGTYFYRYRNKSLSHKFYKTDSYSDITKACGNLRKYYNENDASQIAKLNAFEINAKGCMFVNNFIQIRKEHKKKNTKKSILFDMFEQMISQK